MKSAAEKDALRKQKLDEKVIRLIEDLLEKDVVRDSSLGILLDIKSRKTSRGFLVEAERLLVKEICERYEDYDYEFDLRNRLANVYNLSVTHAESGSFIQSVIEYFDKHNYFTPLQLEQIILLVQVAEKVLTDAGEEV